MQTAHSVKQRAQASAQCFLYCEKTYCTLSDTSSNCSSCWVIHVGAWTFPVERREGKLSPCSTSTTAETGTKTHTYLLMILFSALRENVTHWKFVFFTEKLETILVHLKVVREEAFLLVIYRWGKIMSHTDHIITVCMIPCLHQWVNCKLNGYQEPSTARLRNSAQSLFPFSTSLGLRWC